MHGQAAFMRLRADLMHTRFRHQRAARHIMSVLQTDEPRLREVIDGWPDLRFNAGPGEDAVRGSNGARHHAGDHADRADLIIENMTAPFHYHFLTGLRMQLHADEIAHT